MQREGTAIDGGEEVLPKPWHQTKRKKTGTKEADDKDSAMTDNYFQQPAICVPDALKTMFEPCLKAHQGVLASV